jgi:hypothetical protein
MCALKSFDFAPAGRKGALAAPGPLHVRPAGMGSSNYPGFPLRQLRKKEIQAAG